MARILGLTEPEQQQLGLAGRRGLLSRVAGALVGSVTTPSKSQSPGGGFNTNTPPGGGGDSLADQWVSFLLSQDEAARRADLSPPPPSPVQAPRQLVQQQQQQSPASAAAVQLHAAAAAAAVGDSSGLLPYVAGRSESGSGSESVGRVYIHRGSRERDSVGVGFPATATMSGSDMQHSYSMESLHSQSPAESLSQQQQQDWARGSPMIHSTPTNTHNSGVASSHLQYNHSAEPQAPASFQNVRKEVVGTHEHSAGSSQAAGFQSQNPQRPPIHAYPSYSQHAGASSNLAWENALPHTSDSGRGDEAGRVRESQPQPVQHQPAAVSRGSDQGQQQSWLTPGQKEWS